MTHHEKESPSANGSKDRNSSELQKNPQQYLEMRLQDLLHNERNTKILEKLQIETVPKAKLAHIFIEQGERDLPESIRLVSTKNIRVGELHGGRFEEKTISEGMCAGIYVPDVDALERDILERNPGLVGNMDAVREHVKERAYISAEHIRRSLVPTFSGRETNPQFHIAVALDGQLSLWEQVGMFGDIKPFRKQAVSPRDVIQTLFYDQNGKREGPLAKLGIRFQTQGAIVPELDILFVKKDEEGKKKITPVTLWGWKKSGELIPYNNVVGLVCMEKNVPVDRRKAYMRQVNTTLRYWMKDPNVQAMNVDAELLKKWKEKGGALVTQEEIDREVSIMTPKKQVAHGFQTESGLDSMSLTVIENQQQIGGNKIIVYDTRSDGTKEASIFDFGWAYQDDPAGSGFPNRATFERGMGPYLEKLFPKIRRLYRTDLLAKSLDRGELEKAMKGYSFIASELYHRLDPQEFDSLVRERVPKFSQQQRLKDKLKEIDGQYYTDKVLYLAVLLSHAHTDHWGGIPLIRYDIPVGLTPASEVFLNAQFRTGWHFTMQEPLIRREREKEKMGTAYGTEVRSTLPFANHETHSLSPNMTATAHYVDHSIIGSTGFIVTMKEESVSKSVAYLGDMRKGSLTDEAIQRCKDVDALIIEGTNISSDKPSVGVTELRVQENMEKFRKEEDIRGGAFFVQLDTNHLERLANLIGASGGRKVAVPLSTARLLHEFEIYNDTLPREERIVVPPLEDIIVFQQPKSKYNPWEQQLMRTCQTVTINDIMAHPKQFVLVLKPQQLLSNLFSGIPKSFTGTILRSTYWPYDNGEKIRTLTNYRWAREHGMKYLADIDLSYNSIRTPTHPIGLHASGHMTEEELMDTVATVASGKRLQTVIPIHTIHRGRYQEKLKRFLGQNNISLFPETAGVRIQRGIGKGGAVITLWERNKKR